MFEEIMVMVGFAVLSIILSYVLLKYSPEPIRTLIRAIAINGIIFHELFHVLMCFLTRTPIEQVKVIEKTNRATLTFGINYGEYLKLKSPHKVTFLQAFLIGFGPLYFSFWLFFFLLDHLVNAPLDDLICVLYVIIMVSLTLSAAPSLADLLSVVGSLSFNWKYSLYQIVLLGISIGTVWLTLIYYQLEPLHEILYYIVIGILYFGYNYSIKLVKGSLKWLFGKKNVAGTMEISRARRLFRGHAKPIRPPRLEREEFQW